MDMANLERLSGLLRSGDYSGSPAPLHVVVADHTPTQCFAGFLASHGIRTDGSGADIDLSRAVPGLDADLGLLIPESGVRTWLYDETGKPIDGNRIIALCSAVVLDEAPSGCTVVTDSLTSVGVSRFINDWNAEHYRFKSGSDRVLEEARRLNESGVHCPLAVTVTGHAAFEENNFVEDGLYTAAKLIGKAAELKQKGQRLTALIEDLKEPVERASLRLNITSPDTCHTAVTAVVMVLARANGSLSWHIAPDNREGVRIFRDINSRRDACFLQLRLSSKSPTLGLHLESNVEGGIRQTLQQVHECIGSFPGIDDTPLINLLQTGEGLEISKGDVSHELRC